VDARKGGGGEDREADGFPLGATGKLTCAIFFSTDGVGGVRRGKGMGAVSTAKQNTHTHETIDRAFSFCVFVASESTKHEVSPNDAEEEEGETTTTLHRNTGSQTQCEQQR
jgi:hypothetical protein